MNYMKKKAAVLYHYPCPDGTFAALAAYLYFTATSSPAQFFPNTVYNPILVEHLLLSEIGDVYILDSVGPHGFIQELSSKVQKVIVLDHHKTTLEALGGATPLAENVMKLIDMERSGATIAYDYFKKKLTEQNPRTHEPVLSEFERMRKTYEYIEDADLWKWRLENSKAFSSGLKGMRIEYDCRINPGLFQQLLSLELEHVISEGVVSLAHKQRLITEALDRSFVISLGGGEFGSCLAIIADEGLSELRSELGHQLACKSQDRNFRGIGAVVYRVPELEDHDRRLKISLRSVKDEDTTPILLKCGGGGHRNATSFLLNVAEFQKWKLNC